MKRTRSADHPFLREPRNRRWINSDSNRTCQVPSACTKPVLLTSSHSLPPPCYRRCVDRCANADRFAKAALPSRGESPAFSQESLGKVKGRDFNPAINGRANARSLLRCLSRSRSSPAVPRNRQSPLMNHAARPGTVSRVKPLVSSRKQTAAYPLTRNLPVHPPRNFSRPALGVGGRRKQRAEHAEEQNALLALNRRLALAAIAAPASPRRAGSIHVRVETPASRCKPTPGGPIDTPVAVRSSVCHASSVCRRELRYHGSGTLIRRKQHSGSGN